MIKSKLEIENMIRAGQIVAKTLKILEECIKPGVTTIELNNLAKEYIISQGALCSFENYEGFPYSICSSLNDVVIHGFPSSEKLKDGDVLSVDVGACYNGFHGDAARTFAVGIIANEAQKLIEVTKQCFFEGIKHAKVGKKISDISRAIFIFAKNNNLGVVRKFCGHGIGKNLHEAPSIPNYITNAKSERIQKGMAIAIEPMINLGGDEVDILKDGWTVVTKDKSLSAHYENTVLITNEEPKILTMLNLE
jgi:methionyl aminopeptidase